MMKILVDECLPARIKSPFEQNGHDCRTVRELGLGSKKNGELLTLAEGSWDVLLTNDRNIEHQQNMAGRTITILVFHAKSNRLEDLLPLVPSALSALGSIKPGEIVNIGKDREE